MTDETFNTIKANDERGILTRDLCEQMERTVLSLIPMRLFSENYSMKRTEYHYYLQHALPFLVSEQTIRVYILKLLIENHNDKTCRTYPNRRNDMFMIFGMMDNYQDFPSIQWVLDNYRFVYKNLFTEDLHYPQEFVTEVIRCFENSDPMPHIYGGFSKMFFGRTSIPFLKFVAAVLNRYEDTRLEKYFDTVISRFISCHEGYRAGYAYIQDIMLFIFGQCFCQNTFHKGVKTKGPEAFHSPEFRLKRIIMRCAWPYIYAHYHTKHDIAYKMMMLTDEEAAEYDRKYYEKPIRTNEATLQTTVLDPVKTKYPNGSTFDDIKNWIQWYFRTKVAQTREIPTKSKIMQDIVKKGAKGIPVLRDIKYMDSNSAYRRHLGKLIDDTANAYIAQFAADNDAEVATGKNRVVLYIPSKGWYSKTILDASAVCSDRFQKELIIFRKYVFRGQEYTRKNVKKVKDIINALERLSKYKINGVSELKKEHIYIYLHQCQMMGHKPATISQYLYELKMFINSVIQDKRYPYAPSHNVADSINFMNRMILSPNYKCIPEDILCFIESHLWEMDEDYRIIYQIMKQTLWRFCDVASLKTDAMEMLEDGKFASIKVETNKTKAALRKHHLSPIFEDVITADLYKQIKEYIAATNAARKAHGTTLIFFQGRNNTVKEINQHAFNEAFNELLNRYQIKSIDETFTRFSCSQTRTTGATFLIEEDEGLPIVRNKLGHLNEKTTALFYAHVRNERLSEKNKKYFDSQFADLFNDKKFSIMTKHERQKVYEEIEIALRKVEFGKCAAPVCTDDCKRHGTMECAECPKLITGPQYLSFWVEYKNASDSRIKDLEAVYNYKQIDADTYKGFPEYQEEIKRNTAYQAVINRIRKYKDEKDG